MLPSGRFFIEEDPNVHYAVDVFGITPTTEEDQSRMASVQNFADTVCKIRRVVPAVLLPDQKVVRASEP